MTVSYIGISGQDAGEISFSVGSRDRHPDYAVTVVATDFNGAVVYEQALAVEGWFANEGGQTGYAGPFTPPSGSAAVAYVHRPGSGHRLAQISFNMP